ncbi:MAG: hypothetical protein Q9160_007524 [Pyrenula sp. 1 TL-2023]
MTICHRIHKRSISPPFFPTKAHSYMPSSPPPSPVGSDASSASSMSSASSTSSFELTDLRSCALSILGALTASHDFAAAETYIDPFCRVSHDDEPPTRSRLDLIAAWEERAQRNPGMQVVVKEAAVDEGQMKVWISSELRGLEGGRVRMEVEMLSFDKRGLLVEWSDCGRLKRTEDDE